MPYIIQDRRVEFECLCEPSATYIDADDAGQLNYLFTKVILAYIQNKKLSYQTINDIIGALEGAKMEFYRRVAVPYEQSKIRTNGDVYPT